ncbi:MAG: hypothetical protein AB8U25_01430 [Rickettsiales endosymbiont of Dermacentor nuttalli]
MNKDVCFIIEYERQIVESIEQGVTDKLLDFLRKHNIIIYVLVDVIYFDHIPFEQFDSYHVGDFTSNT